MTSRSRYPEGFQFRPRTPRLLGPAPPIGVDWARRIRAADLRLSMLAASNLHRIGMLGEDEEATLAVIVPLIAHDLATAPVRTLHASYFVLGEHARWTISQDGRWLMAVRRPNPEAGLEPGPGGQRSERKAKMGVNRRGTQFSLQTVLRQSNGQCWLCHKALTLDEATRDHVIPRALGGAWSIRNLRTACKACNEQRGYEFPAAALKLLDRWGRSYGTLTRSDQSKLWEASGGRCQECDSDIRLIFYVPDKGPRPWDRIAVLCVDCAAKVDPRTFRALVQEG